MVEVRDNHQSPQSIDFCSFIHDNASSTKNFNLKRRASLTIINEHLFGSDVAHPIRHERKRLEKELIYQQQQQQQQQQKDSSSNSISSSSEKSMLGLYDDTFCSSTINDLFVNRQIIAKQARAKLYKQFLQRGVESRYSQKDDLAIHYFVRASKLRPNHFEAFFELGLTYHVSGWEHKTIQNFQIALNICRREMRAPFHCRTDSFSNLNPSDVAPCYAALTTGEIQRAESYSFILEGLLLLITDPTENNLQQALGQFYTALKIDPNCSFAYSSIGNIFDMRGEYTTAISYYNKALETGPLYSPCVLYASIGRCHELLDDTKSALASYKRSVELNPNYIHGLRQRAKIYMKMNKFKKAMADYTRMIDINPFLASTFMDRADLFYFHLSQLPNAMNDYHMAMKIDPKRHYPYKVLSAIHMVHGLPSSSTCEEETEEQVPGQQAEEDDGDLAIIFLDDKMLGAMNTFGANSNCSLTTGDDDVHSIHFERLSSMTQDEAIREAVAILDRGLESCTDVHGLSELYELRSQVLQQQLVMGMTLKESDNDIICTMIEHDKQHAQLWPESSIYLLHKACLLSEATRTRKFVDVVVRFSDEE